MSAPPQLARSLGLSHATLLGLGSMVGTGVFVSIGIGAGLAGPSVVLAVGLAALVAAANALSSAQLAASIPVSGGTYEYAGRLISPAAGFTAGWMFLCAKAASAATAALGFAGYVLGLAGAGDDGRLAVLIAVAAVAALTAVSLAGIRRSAAANAAIVAVTLGALGLFIVVGGPVAMQRAGVTLTPILPARAGLGGFVEATALMFVAYTGYGRIATLGEEVREPRRTIPRAIIASIALAAALYAAVALVAVGTIGAPALAEATRGAAAPLAAAAEQFGPSWLARAVAIGAITAMLGVLLNLILGLSRVLFAMGRRRDMPAVVSRVSRTTAAPSVAIAVVGVAVAALALVGSVKTTWSFSAFTVLVYYALTNASALRLPREQRLFHPAIPAAGLAACLSLAFFVEPRIWLTGLGVIAAGLIWRRAARRIAARGR